MTEENRLKACEYNDIEAVKLIIDKNNELNINIQNEYGNTPLHFACVYNNIEMVKLLLKYKNVDVNMQNVDKETPLHIACELCNFDIIKLLLDHNAVDINLQNNKNETAYDILNNFSTYRFKEFFNQIDEEKFNFGSSKDYIKFLITGEHYDLEQLEKDFNDRTLIILRNNCSDINKYVNLLFII
jgi:hypothetical protein